MKSKPYLKYLVSTFFFKWCRWPLGYVLSLVAVVLLLLRVERVGVLMLLKSLRVFPSAFSIRLFKKYVPLDFSSYLQKDVPEEEAFHRSIILSLPRRNGDVIQKGVIIVTFTRTFAYYLNHPQFELFNKYFLFVLEPSWSGYADPEILDFLVRAEHCLVQATEQEDSTLLNAMFPAGVATSFGASDWVNPSKFLPTKATKKYDSIYVANMNPIKRVFRYIDAVEIISRSFPDYRGCLVCAGWGGGSESIESYIASKNMGDSILYIPGLEQEELIKVINQSKVNILLSLKEGSNRSLFESMFLDVPVICISENIGVNKSYINEFSGLLIADAFLEDALISMRDNWKNYRPRNWALRNISPDVTTAKLATLLELRFGPICNSSLAVKANTPEVSYLDEDIDHVEITAQLLGALSASNEPLFWDNVEKATLPERKVVPELGEG